ncbi:MAG: glycerol-3-phosphate acyltransferase, partial [Anaerolineales bacterium]
MQDVLINIAVGLTAYLIGSLPFALWITRWRTGQDIRAIGSGHVGATNALRAAGWQTGAVVALLDFAKGYAALSLALRWGTWEGTQAIASAAVVIGHCWPVFARFRGGMGVAPAAGALAALWPAGLGLALALGVAMQLLWRHTARANVVTGLGVGPLWIGASAPAWT